MAKWDHVDDMVCEEKGVCQGWDLWPGAEVCRYDVYGSVMANGFNLQSPIRHYASVRVAGSGGEWEH